MIKKDRNYGVIPFVVVLIALVAIIGALAVKLSSVRSQIQVSVRGTFATNPDFPMAGQTYLVFERDGTCTHCTQDSVFWVGEYDINDRIITMDTEEKSYYGVFFDHAIYFFDPDAEGVVLYGQISEVPIYW